MITFLKITNSNDDSFVFEYPYRMRPGFDLSSLAADVHYAESMNDGSVYQNTKLANREFEIPFNLMKISEEITWLEEERSRLFRIFNPITNPMRIDIKTATGKEYYLNAQLLGTPVMPTDNGSNNPAYQRILLQFSSNEPYIYEKHAKQVDIATWKGAFSFPLKISQGQGIRMGYRSNNLIANAINTGQSKTGMTVRFKALATVLNPSIISVNTYQHLKLNTEMTQGDIIEVSTYTGKKSVTLIRNNQRIDIFNTVDLESDFLQLDPGDNLFRYDAEEGLDNLEVTLTYIPRMVGV